ncbi:MAG: hypothetical protein IPM92_17505 [Saprospiraceae bacterium]|nr:hypothetical protein [Saprospiraceae bacterium]
MLTVFGENQKKKEETKVQHADQVPVVKQSLKSSRKLKFKEAIVQEKPIQKIEAKNRNGARIGIAGL